MAEVPLQKWICRFLHGTLRVSYPVKKAKRFVCECYVTNISISEYTWFVAQTTASIILDMIQSIGSKAIHISVRIGEKKWKKRNESNRWSW